MAAALAALHEHGVDAPLEHLLGVALGADRRDDDDARVVQAADQLRLRCLGEARDLDALVDHQADPVVDVAGVGAEVDAERLVGALLDLGDRRRAARRSPSSRWRGCRGAPALAVRRHEAGAGDPAHAGLHDRDVDADEIAQRRVQAGRDASRRGDLAVAEARPGRGARSPPSSSACGRAGLGDVADDVSSKPVLATTSSTVTPGCTLTRRIAVVGRLEVEHGEVGDHPRQPVVLAHPGRQRRRPVVAEARSPCRPSP